MTVTELTQAEAAFRTLLNAARALMDGCPELTVFSGPLPDAPFAPRAAHAVPMLGTLQAMLPTPQAEDANANAAFVRAVHAVAPFAEWRRSYSEAEVGADFLARYGWFELLGPEGHFQCDTHRAYVGIWGSDLYYPWHAHEAEEIYYCAAGSAIFEAEGDAPAVLTPGQTKAHTGHQPHAMTTQGSPILTFVLWRGPGMAGKPAMTDPADALLTEVVALQDRTPALADFGRLSKALPKRSVTPHPIPAAALMAAEPALTSPGHAGLCAAIQAYGPHAHWRETYRGTAIPPGFLDRFGCFALAGPNAPFAAQDIAAFFVYMPPGLHYPWHEHPAEELYYILAGSARFRVGTEPERTLHAGDHVFHASGAPHMTVTDDAPMLALVLWRGDLATRPVLSSAP
ncbi:MAG: dimethylsulfonioproprionate lyase family protein [Pseudomonadota bacterium]